MAPKSPNLLFKVQDQKVFKVQDLREFMSPSPLPAALLPRVPLEGPALVAAPPGVGRGPCRVPVPRIVLGDGRLTRLGAGFAHAPEASGDCVGQLSHLRGVVSPNLDFCSKKLPSPKKENDQELRQ